jgi:hypothetical protein
MSRDGERRRFGVEANTPHSFSWHLGFLLRLVMSNEYFLSSVMICEKEMRAKLFVVGVFCLVIVGVIREL